MMRLSASLLILAFVAAGAAPVVGEVPIEVAADGGLALIGVYDDMVHGWLSFEAAHDDALDEVALGKKEEQHHRQNHGR